MKELSITGDKFIKLGVKEICRLNNVEYNENLIVPHIKYDSSVNDDYDYQMIRTSTNDGTLYFTFETLFKMFSELTLHQTYYKPTFKDISIENIRNLEYTIGDVFIEEIDMKVEGKNFPMTRETFTIPVKTKLIQG